MERITSHLVDAAVIKNTELHITGALVCTGTDFAQYLEGDPKDVEQLMFSIYADPRHKDINIMKYVSEPKRRFEQWSLAYSGLSPLVSVMIDRARASNAIGSDRGVRDLITFLERFAVRPNIRQFFQKQLLNVAA